MPIPEFDPRNLSVEERLDLIDLLWQAIEEDAENGDPAAIEALSVDPDPGEPDLDPLRASWENLLAELRRKRP